MRLFAPKRPRAPRPEIAGELRSVESRLRGWTVTGSGGVDLEDLLRRAALELEISAERELRFLTALRDAGSELEAGNDRGAKHIIQDALPEGVAS